MKILAHSYLNANGLSLNGEKLHSTSGDLNFTKPLYEKLLLEYPKFYKMDILSKMAMLCAKVLEPFFPEQTELEDQLHLIMANSHSSYDTDLKFMDSYQVNHNPSPSLFVYTLPNILNGELMIRYKWYGENSFFIEKEFNPNLYLELMKLSKLSGNNYALCGWVDAEKTESAESFLFLVSLNSSLLDKEDLQSIYNKYRNE